MYRFFNWFWGMVGAYAFITGLGLVLSGLSMLDLGYVLGSIILICVGIVLAFFGRRLEVRVQLANKAGRGYDRQARV